jgi:alpha/beta superfamily hydrolase
VIEEALRIDSDGLALEGRYAYAEDGDGAAAVLICPPHPFLGGDMDNNVVAALNDALVAHGMTVLRFNYRGIGASETARDVQADLAAFWRDSACPGYEDDIHRDCAAALGALQREHPDVPTYVVGYSFGCLPAMALSGREAVARLLLIAPPLAKWTLEPAPAGAGMPCALFFAPGDFACPAALVEALYARLPEPRELRAFDDADHFFVGHEAALTAAACRFLEAP